MANSGPQGLSKNMVFVPNVLNLLSNRTIPGGSLSSDVRALCLFVCFFDSIIKVNQKSHGCFDNED